MGENALALGAGLLGPDRMGNLGAEHLDFAAIGLPQQGGDLFRKIGSAVHHRQQDAVDLELGVQLPLDLADGGQQLFQALGGQVLRLDGDYDPVGCRQCIDRKHPQGGLAVDEDMGILSLHGVQILPQDGLAAHGVYQRHLHARQLDVGGHEVHALRVVQDALAGFDRLVHEDAAHRVGQGKGQLVRLRVAQADGEAGLRVSIHQQHLLPGLGQPYP